MKALVLTAPGQFIYEERPEPVCREQDVKVRVEAVCVCGSDVSAILGRNALFTYPRVLGHEVAGIVTEVGPAVRGVQKGDRVALMPCISCGHCRACRKGKTNCCESLRLYGVKEDGGMQEILCPPATNWLKLPAGMKAHTAAMIEPLTIGAHAVGRLSFGEEDRVLVIGAGPIGMSCAVNAAARGAQVLLADTNENRCTFCRSRFPFGTVNVLGDQYRQKLEAFTEGELFDAVIDTTAAPASMNHAWEYLCQGGELLFVGIHSKDLTWNDFSFHMKEPALFTTRNSTRADYEKVLSLIGDGLIDPDRFITHVTPFEKAADELLLWVRPETGVYKGVITF